MEQISKRLMNWASILEDQTRDQAVVTSGMPFIFPHLALMPDAHLGKGATVGSVIPTLGAIMPAAVGVDIGCGMMAVKTGLTSADLPDDKRALHRDICDVIPLSAGQYNTQSYDVRTRERVTQLAEYPGAVQAEQVAENWFFQLGSLGSGNHFIEVSLDEVDNVWLFLHSGSRGVGNKLAMKYIKIAQQQCKDRWITLPDRDLAYLVEGDKEFWDYMEALRWAQKFAYLNREEMMDRVIDVFTDWVGVDPFPNGSEVINCHHNYTEQETHFGKKVWLSRKGAINAEMGRKGLIPGSMGTRSYVVTGLGNTLSLNSSPHGAGRNHSRTAAKKLFTREDLDARMEGIAWGNSDEFLDEHPDAYKDIDVIMQDASDLVKIDHELRQIVNVKGD